MCVCACVRACMCLCVCVPVCVYPLLHYIFCCSEFSDSVMYTCAAAAPEAPPTPECVDIGVRHVTVRWSSPDDNGGDHYCIS